jgi:hypothetical protein
VETLDTKKENSIERAHEIDELIVDHVKDLADVTAQDMAHIFMVAMAMKPVTDLNFSPLDVYPGGKDQFNIDMILLNDLLMMLGLASECIEKPDGFTHIIISNEDGPLHELTQIYKEAMPGIDPAVEYRGGLLRGFPETAVNAYAHNMNTHLLKWNTEPAEIKNDPAYPFLDFRLSKGHFKEEFQKVRDQAEVLKKFAPLIYESVLEEWKRVILPN